MNECENSYEDPHECGVMEGVKGVYRAGRWQIGRGIVCAMLESWVLILKAEVRLFSWGSNMIKFPFQNYH